MIFIAHQLRFFLMNCFLSIRFHTFPKFSHSIPNIFIFQFKSNYFDTLTFRFHYCQIALMFNSIILLLILKIKIKKYI
jgi:hypothetical protein